MHPFDPNYENNGTIIDQAFQHGTAPPVEDMMTAMPMPMAMPMPVPVNNQSQMVPNVMMDMPDDKFQQQNAQANYMAPLPVGYDGAPQQQQPGTYDLNVPPFDIEDPLLRRQFFRKVFIILLIQKLCAIPIMEVFVLCVGEPVNSTVSATFELFGFLLYIPMYIFSDYRRFSPVNYLIFGYITLYLGIQAGIYATNVGQLVALTSQLTLALEFLILIAFSKQSRFRFTNMSGILLSLFLYLVFSVFIGLVAPHIPHGVELWIAFIVMYCIYDIQLQLSGHHGYNLKVEEHIFAVCNIYADIPNLVWRLFRYLFLDHFVRIYNFFKKCCYAEVC